jgi:hypothetical protein
MREININQAKRERERSNHIRVPIWDRHMLTTRSRNGTKRREHEEVKQQQRANEFEAQLKGLSFSSDSARNSPDDDLSRVLVLALSHSDEPLEPVLARRMAFKSQLACLFVSSCEA